MDLLWSVNKVMLRLDIFFFFFGLRTDFLSFVFEFRLVHHSTSYRPDQWLSDGYHHQCAAIWVPIVNVCLLDGCRVRLIIE